MRLHYLFYGTHLEEGEEILFVAHKHWVFFLKPALKFLLFGVTIPLLIFLFFPQLYLVSLGILVLSLSVYALEFCDWYFDAWLVTTLSIIDLEWIDFFNRRSSRIDYETIEGVSYQTDGFWGFLLNFATIQIDKASGSNSIILPGAHHAKKIELEILKHRNTYINSRNLEDEETLKSILTTMIRRQIQSNPEE